jgi:serine O-acetyltransferase
VFCDPLWNSIQADALIEADREPLLRTWIEQVILQRDSLGDGIAMLLSQRLFGADSHPSPFYDELRSVVADHSTISESARRDLSAIRNNDPATASLLHPFLNFKGFHALQAHRIAHALWSGDRRALAYHVQSRASEVFGVDIHPAAKIGAGVFIDHATGVVIGETAVVGDDVTILHGVTLGGTGKESGDRHPKVGRGVFIGAGAQLLGNIAVGDGARVGASSVVLKHVDSHTTVAGIPARVVHQRPRPTVAMPTLDAKRA